MPQITVDPKKCIGCNTCPLIDPDTFVLDPKTYKATVKKQPTKITEAQKTAKNSCPVGAITIQE